MAKKSRKNRKKLQANKEKQLLENDSLGDSIPKSFIFHRGKIGRSIQDLVMDMRRVMSPYTASRLSEKKSNSIKDFVTVAPTLGVTHFMIFNQTTKGSNLRLIKVPQGPTLTFRIKSYSLMKDIANMSKKPHSPSSEYLAPPLIVMNNFNNVNISSTINNDILKIQNAMIQSFFHK